MPHLPLSFWLFNIRLTAEKYNGSQGKHQIKSSSKLMNSKVCYCRKSSLATHINEENKKNTISFHFGKRHLLCLLSPDTFYPSFSHPFNMHVLQNTCGMFIFSSSEPILHQLPDVLVYPDFLWGGNVLK